MLAGSVVVATVVGDSVVGESVDAEPVATVVAVHDEACPRFPLDEEPAVGFAEVLHAELHEPLIRARHVAGEELEDPVLAELGVHLELGLSQWGAGRQVPDALDLGLRLQEQKGLQRSFHGPEAVAKVLELGFSQPVSQEQFESLEHWEHGSPINVC